MREDQRGLTLVELVAVLAIAVILTTAVAIRISASTDAARLRAAAEWTAAVMRHAVRLSWVQQTPVRLQFQPGSMDVLMTVWNGSTWVPATDLSPPGFDRPSGAVVSSTTYPSDTLTVSPIGLGTLGVEAAVHTTEGSVTVSTGQSSMRVFTTQYGEVRIAPGP